MAAAPAAPATKPRRVRPALRSTVTVLVARHRGAPFSCPGRVGGFGAGIGRERLEAWLVRVVAVGAEEVLLVPVPVPRPAAVDAGLPVPELLPVALAAEPVRLLERDPLAARKVELVAVVRVVAVKAPAVLGVVRQLDVRVEVGQRPARPVRLHRGVTAGAGEDPLGERGRRHLEVLDGVPRRRRGGRRRRSGRE